MKIDDPVIRFCVRFLFIALVVIVILGFLAFILLIVAQSVSLAQQFNTQFNTHVGYAICGVV
jgi:hypothetical protein